MKKPLNLFAAGLTALALAVTPVQAFRSTYRDISGTAWYAESVAFCQHNGLMDGASDIHFQPEEQMTRATLAEALYRLEGSPEASGEELPFPDVEADHPNLAAIRWAKETGVVNGYDNGNFGPGDPITREQIAVLLWNLRGRQEAAAVEYADREEISAWALPAVEWAYEACLMSGNEENRFMPLNNTTRGEGAVITYNYARYFYDLPEQYPLPEPRDIPANPYSSESFQVDENGYMTYTGGEVSYRGLDVSAHQKEIDWERVAGSGMEFAMIRAGYRGYTWGTIVKDAYFDYNIQNALANGLEVGVYFFSQALTPEEAEEEAYQLLEWVKDYEITYPLVFDWEEQDKDGSRSQNADGNTVTACALAFCKVIEEAGYTPMTYGSPSKVYRGGLMLDYLQDYPFWLAHYTRDMAPTSFRYQYNIWQYSSTGQVDGIEGNVDLNICLTGWSAPEKEEEETEYPWWLWPV